MTDTFNIQKVKFDFAMESEAMAFELNSSWHSFYQSSFAAVADRVFRKFNPQNRHLLIERIELDLGEIKQEDFYTKFPVLLAQKLEEQLAEYLLTDADNRQIRELTREQLSFEAFSFFLVHGNSPWADQSVSHDIHELFRKVYAETAAELRRFLFQQGHLSSMRRRLVYQLHDPELEKLVVLLNKTESTFIIAYTHLLINERAYPEKAPARADDHRNAVWYLVISYLLTNRESRFNQKEFVRQTIRELALHYNLKYALLLGFLIDVLEKTETYFIVKPELESILKELDMEQNKEPDGTPEQKETDALKQLLKTENIDFKLSDEIVQRIMQDRSFRQKLMREFSTKQLARLCEMIEKSAPSAVFKRVFETEISDFLQENTDQLIDQKIGQASGWEKGKGFPEYLKDEYLNLLRQPLSRRKLLRRLNESQITGLVKLVEPAEAGFIIAYSQSLDRQHERNLFEGKTGGEFRQLKWEFIFTVLVDDHLPQFNRKGFVFSVISMLAAHYSLDASNLLAFIYKGMLSNEFPMPENLAEIIKELYFETREQKHKKQEVDLFSKEIQETYYADLLLDYLQTGFVRNSHFDDKIYSVFQYLETYRKDLLLRLTENLKSGIIIANSHPLPFQKELYRDLILFVISNYQVNLPGGRNVKSFLENLADDRYRAVPVEALKSMLLAILKNDPELYELSWNLLTEKTKDIGVLHEMEFSLIGDESLLKILSFHNQPGFKKFVLDRKKEINQRLVYGKPLFYNFATLCNNQPPVTETFSEIWGADFVATIEQALFNFFPAQKEQTSFLFQLMKSSIFRGKQNFLASVFLRYATALFSGKQNAAEQFINDLVNLNSGLKKETILKEAGSLIERKKFSKALQAAIHKAIQSVSENKQKTAVEKNTKQSADEYFIVWLIAQFGTKQSGTEQPFFSSEDASVKFAFAQFESILIDHPELIRKQMETGVLSAAKLAQWIKTAPVPLQLRWLQISAAPYHRIVIQETFTLLNWMRQYFAAHNLHLPEKEITDLLIDFSSGKYQNLSQRELFVIILKLSLKNTDTAEHADFLSEIKRKAANRGVDWEQKITAIQQKLKNEKQQMEDSDLPVKSEISKKVIENDEQILETIYIRNAGLVLCSPFLPRLFSLLNLTVEGRFEDEKMRERAVLLLQYLVFQDTYFPENEMVLNKIVCGFITGAPINPMIEVNEKEKETLEKMLQGMIQNWRSIGNTSPAGLRESFLMREGKLEQKDDAWFLTVEQKGYDVLLDQLPWSYTPIKHPWMKKIIHVKWR